MGKINHFPSRCEKTLRPIGRMPAPEHTAEGFFLVQVIKQIICDFRQMSLRQGFFPHRETMVLHRTRRWETGEGPVNRHVLMATLSKIGGGVGGAGGLRKLRSC